MSDNNLVYILDNKVYINLTNRCTNDCIFCLRNDKDDVCGQDMRLKTENITSHDVIDQLKQYEDILPAGLTFCGYGEPTLKFQILKEVAKYVKEHYPETYIKINTNGHGNIINKHNILPELKGIVDEVSISLNAHNEELYNELCLPKIKNAYSEMLRFAQEAVSEGFKTTMSVVSGYKDYDVKTDKCSEIAKNTGANFRAREWIKNGY
ncbi:MAG: TatD family nuclease-associated radical SAM protein [Candidatus Gastranaerophilales bacterium]|nr:TatD family nuclease-associated radical SAM protein [Candidatus Gastranaerophilales bacterium]